MVLPSVPLAMLAPFLTAAAFAAPLMASTLLVPVLAAVVLTSAPFFASALVVPILAAVALSDQREVAVGRQRREGTLWAGTDANEKAQATAIAPPRTVNFLTIRLPFEC